MSGEGAPTTLADGSNLRVAIVHAAWHADVMKGLLEGARRGLADCRVEEVDGVGHISPMLIDRERIIALLRELWAESPQPE